MQKIENKPLHQQVTFHDLKGKSVFISGGATGIGRDLVAAFVAQEAIVSFVDIDQAQGEALVKELGSKNCHFTACDVTNFEALNNAIQAAEKRGSGLEVLLNNAANDQRHDFYNATPEFFDKAIAINLKHQFFAAQQAAKFMKERGRGVILNFGSVAPRVPAQDLHIYIACKAGVRGLTRSMAKTLGADGIRVNAIVPGAILTEKQLKLWISEEDVKEILADQVIAKRLNGMDVAAMALFLASDISAGCSGHEYIVDGGLCY